MAEEAWLANNHVPGVLSGKQPLVASMDGYVTVGGEDEAAEYVEENGKPWQASPGAIAWLVEATRKWKPRRRRSRVDV
ncbi:hypothetical protein ACG873_13240 [Mesorhizobium sp. AaZ16]|uniref:hypothetical protein n=1 Tax=Mesorhizobium sp. AaZ16 TaxID=3402289 RepID=UPI00374EF3B7